MARAAAKTQEDPVQVFVEEFTTLIKDGLVDAELSLIDTVISARVQTLEDERKQKSASNGAVRKVEPGTGKTPDKLPPAPVKKPPTPVVALEIGKTYRLADKTKTYGGQKVKFLYFKNGDEEKAVVELLAAGDSWDKGKKIVVHPGALSVAANGRRVAK